MIFVTGGTGFIGSHLLRQLTASGEVVRALIRDRKKIPAEFSESVDWVEGNVLDITSLEDVISGCTKVYHIASVVSFQPKQRAQMMQINVVGTANVMNTALELKIQKLVHVSSVAAICRNPGEHFIREDTPWQDRKENTHYSISKHLAEQEVWRAHAEGLNMVIVNPSLVIGSGNWHKGTPRFFLDSYKGLPAYTSGASGLVAVDDVAAIMIRLMNSNISGERFIISNEYWSLKDLFFTICDLLHRKPPPFEAKPWMIGLIWRYEALKSFFTHIDPLISKETSRIAQLQTSFDNGKIVKAINYQFKPIKICLEETAAKFLEDFSEGKIKV